jgi:plasmid stabilization system protein ParE
MAYRIKFLPKAKQDLETIYRRIIQEAQMQGSEWFSGLERSIASLRNHPERCMVVTKFSTRLGETCWNSRRPWTASAGELGSG